MRMWKLLCVCVFCGWYILCCWTVRANPFFIDSACRVRIRTKHVPYRIAPPHIILSIVSRTNAATVSTPYAECTHQPLTGMNIWSDTIWEEQLFGLFQHPKCPIAVMNTALLTSFRFPQHRIIIIKKSLWVGGGVLCIVLATTTTASFYVHKHARPFWTTWCAHLCEQWVLDYSAGWMADKSHQHEWIRKYRMKCWSCWAGDGVLMIIMTNAKSFTMLGTGKVGGSSVSGPPPPR